MEVKLDQHMMVDKAVIRKIVGFAAIKSGDRILEIGGGGGNLTRELASKSNDLIVIEIDKKYEGELKRIKNTKVIIGNALDLIDDLKFDRLVSNIPYAICEPLMGKLIEKEFKLAVLTVPKGFAEIITSNKAKTGIIANACFDVEVLLDVPAKAFEPPPRTDSVIVKLVPIAGKSLQKEVMKRRKLKVKNAIMRALFVARKMTKNQARKAIKSLKLNNNLLEKRLFEADLKELGAVLKSLGSLKKH